MNPVKLLAMPLIGMLFPLELFAQAVVGKLVDEKEQALPYANVVLLSLPDSLFVAGTVSVQDGSFHLDQKEKNSLLRISSIGYETLYLPVGRSDMGVIQLKPDARQLGEVEVKADLPKVRLKGDALVTTVAGSVLEKIGTGNDLLDKIPGVSAKEGEVNVFGSGNAEVYINGRKMRNPSELDQLSSDNIKNVEVVRNPGARYDASVKAVVRINTKKAQGEGWGFDNRFSTSYAYNWTVLDQFDFNYRKGGFDLNGMIMGTDHRYTDKKTLDQSTYLDKVWTQHSYMESPYHQQRLSSVLSLNYQFNENHVMGVRYNYDREPKFDQDIYIQTTLLKGDRLEETSKSVNEMLRENYTHSLNAYYSGRIKDWTVDFNTDFMKADKEMPGTVKEFVTPADGAENQRDLHTFSSNNNIFYAAKLVATHPLWGGTLTLGSEYTYNDSKDFYDNKEAILKGNSNKIKENGVATFLEYAHSFGRLSAQAGIRYEHLASNYYEGCHKSDEQSRVYDQVFPSLSLSYPVGKAQLMLNYAGSIDRPSYSHLSSSVIYGNRYTYEGGNPNLKPSITQRVSLNTSWKWIFFGLTYSHVKDAQIQKSRPYSEKDPSVSIISYVNVPNIDNLNMILSFSPTFGCWSPRLSAMLMQQWFKTETPTGRQNFNNPTAMFRLGNMFQLPADFQIGLDMNISTAGESTTVRIMNPSGSVDLSIYKSFMKDRLKFQIQAIDLFETSIPRVTMYSGNHTIYMNNKERRMFKLTVRYKFNASKSKYRGTGAGESQRRRI